MKSNIKSKITKLSLSMFRNRKLFRSLILIAGFVGIFTIVCIKPAHAESLLPTSAQEDLIQFLFGFAKQTFVSIFQTEFSSEMNEDSSEHLGRQVGHAAGRTIARILDLFGSDTLLN